MTTVPRILGFDGPQPAYRSVVLDRDGFVWHRCCESQWGSCDGETSSWEQLQARFPLTLLHEGLD